MASVRIESEAFEDPRYKLLGNMFGTSRYDALCRMAVIWRYCTERQTYILSPTIIDAITECENFHKAICAPDVGLGEVTEDGIRIRGTKGRIEWLAKLRKQSKKGGTQTKAKWEAKRLAKRGPKVGPNAEPKEGPLTLVLTPALAPSPVPTQIQKTKEHSVGSEVAKAPSASQRTIRVEQFIAAYVVAFQERYGKGTRPGMGGKVFGQVRNFLKNTSGQRALDLIQVYLQMDDPWFLTKCHDMGTFLENLNKVCISLDTGEMHGKAKRKSISELLSEEQTK